VGDLSNGGKATLTIVVIVNLPSTGGLVINNDFDEKCGCNIPRAVLNDGSMLNNKASVTANEADPVPGNNFADANTKINVPILKVTKKDELQKSVNGGINGPTTIRYTVVITNTGKSAVSGVTFSDTPDANSTLVVGSVTTTSGSIITGNNAGNTSVVVNPGTILAGGKVTITFKVTVNKKLPLNTTKISNQGIVSDGNRFSWLSDDPDTLVVGDPTLTQIIQQSTTISSCKSCHK
jgi:uncharacterized repeat protein (TIGR01451 family)